MNSTQQLLDVMLDPTRLDRLSLRAWNSVIRSARASKLLSRLAVIAADQGPLERLPSEVQQHLGSAIVLAERNDALMRWEIRQISRVLAEVAGPVVLLKGAAYLASQLETSRGRLYGDTDILVRRNQLARIEAILKEHNWEMNANPRDEAYFREWMHEIPPLVHRIRGTTLDLHHSILPPTDTLKLDPELLFEETLRLSSLGAAEICLHTLSHRDMILHSVAHLFRNGDFNWGLRDLFDVDSMVRQFATTETFWSRLVERAAQLDLGLPLFCGFRFAKRLLHTPLPDEVVQELDRWKPGGLKLGIVDRLVVRALDRRAGHGVDRGHRRAVSALSYWPLPRLAAMRTPLFWLKRLPLGAQN